MNSVPLSWSEPLDVLIELIGRSGYFDQRYYLNQRDGLRGIREPVRHYLESGWLDGLNPSAAFDTAFYLGANDDVRDAGMHPLVHYLRFGKAEGRAPSEKAIHDVVDATAPSADEWAALPLRRNDRTPLVDVIVPVYRGFAQTMRCIYSVLASTATVAFELWVIDDASPEPALSSALDDLARTGHIQLRRNARNLGLVRTANFGMRLHPARDVVLLNSDTEVCGDWLDRLRAAASRPNVGTVTPFTNNGEISSYPAFLQNYDRPFELTDAELDALFADVNQGECVDIPTAVGFCMYMRRDCLETVGLFDEDHFGTGYGEENDFSRRAAGAGWRNVLAADVFVRHYGGTSFGNSKQQRLRTAYDVVTRLHPEYHDLVAGFIAQDPIAPYRQRVDVERIKRRTAGRTFVFVTHNRGGGTERHVSDLAERISADGESVIFCRGDRMAEERLRIEVPGLALPNLPAIDIPRDLDAFVSTLSAIGVAHLHIHHLADLPETAADFFHVAAARLRVPYDVTVHDYFFICPRINLIDDSGFYCGEPDERACARCLSRAGSGYGSPAIWAWRNRFEHFLRGARAVFVPDRDVALRLDRYFPGQPWVVRPHPEDFAGAVRADVPSASTLQHGGVRRVGLIGAIGAHKGSRLLLDCARIARERGLPLDFYVIGYTDIDAALEDAGVSITGRYAEADLQARIEEAQLDLAWFPSVWPETYCYTLSAALRARVFPVAFDIGAVAARLRSFGWGHVLPLDLFFDSARVVDRLAGLNLAPCPATPAPTASSAVAFVSEYYQLPTWAAGTPAMSLRAGRADALPEKETP